MKLTREDKQNLEGAIQFALFKACQEQQTALTGIIAGNVKRIFNMWNKQGNRAFDSMEYIFTKDNNDMLDRFSDRLHDALHELRKEITNEIIEGKHEQKKD